MLATLIGPANEMKTRPIVATKPSAPCVKNGSAAPCRLSFPGPPAAVITPWSITNARNVSTVTTRNLSRLLDSLAPSTLMATNRIVSATATLRAGKFRISAR